MHSTKLIAILLLKAGPQDLPYSATLSVQMLVLYAFSDYLTILDSKSANIGLILLDVSVLLAFSYILLVLLRLQHRFTQTIAALAGTGIIFNLLSWPLLAELRVDDVPNTVATLVVVLILMLMSWNVLVTAHIYRHALETSMLHAVLLSFALLFVSIALTRLFFPEL